MVPNIRKYFISHAKTCPVHVHGLPIICYVYTRRLKETFWKCRKQNELTSYPFLRITFCFSGIFASCLLHHSFVRGCHWVYCLCFYGGTNFSSAKMITVSPSLSWHKHLTYYSIGSITVYEWILFISTTRHFYSYRTI